MQRTASERLAEALDARLARLFKRVFGTPVLALFVCASLGACLGVRAADRLDDDDPQYKPVIRVNDEVVMKDNNTAYQGEILASDDPNIVRIKTRKGTTDLQKDQIQTIRPRSTVQ